VVGGRRPWIVDGWSVCEGEITGTFGLFGLLNHTRV
jgi:hypothetical protein